MNKLMNMGVIFSSEFEKHWILVPSFFFTDFCTVVQNFETRHPRRYLVGEVKGQTLKSSSIYYNNILLYLAMNYQNDQISMYFHIRSHKIQYPW